MKLFENYFDLSRPVMSFFPDDGAVEAALEVAVEAAKNGGQDGGQLAELVSALGTLVAWNPILIYGASLLGLYKTMSEFFEVIYEKACYETAVFQGGQG